MDIDSVFVTLHFRLVRGITKYFSRPTRFFFEALFFVTAVVILGILAWFHYFHVRAHAGHLSCFPDLKERALAADVIDIRVWSSPEPFPDVTYDLRPYLASSVPSPLSSPPTREGSGGSSSSSPLHSALPEEPCDADAEAEAEPAFAAAAAAAAEGAKGTEPASDAIFSNGHWASDPYQFARERGYFMLSPQALARHGVMRLNITLSSANPCFGNTVMQAITEDMTGYDTILIHQLLREFGEGYLYCSSSRELHSLHEGARKGQYSGLISSVIGKVEMFVTVLFLFFAVTALVSFTLRQTQVRMLHFTGQLRRYVRLGLPFGRLVVVHVLESIGFVPVVVGVLFFLFEFLNDQFLAFMILLLAWVCEMYTVVTVRTLVSMDLFPKVFGLYFFLFGVYFFLFPFGFHYLAMLVCAAFVWHAMFYFWNRHEVPAFEAGVITTAHPRQVPPGARGWGWDVPHNEGQGQGAGAAAHAG